MKSDAPITQICFENDRITYDHQTIETPNRDNFFQHMHNEYEIIYIVSGDCSYGIEDKVYKLKKNNLILVAPTKYHYIRIDDVQSTYERYDLLIDPLLYADNNIPALPPFEILDCSNNGLIADVFKRLDYYCGQLDADSFENLFTALIKELVYCIEIQKNDSDIINSFVQVPIMKQVLSYIEQNLCTIEGTKEIADANYISETYLFRLFKKYLKISPHKYINNKRMLMAQKLIKLGERPNAVFEKCGFAGYTTFFKGYVKYFGHSPSSDYTNTK